MTKRYLKIQNGKLMRALLVNVGKRLSLQREVLRLKAIVKAYETPGRN